MPHKDPEALRAYKQAYYAKHKERIKENRRGYHLTYYAAHAAQMVAKQQAYRQRHPEKVQAYTKTYRKEHQKELAEKGHVYHLSHRAERLEKHRAYDAAHKTERRIYDAAHKAERIAKARERAAANPALARTRQQEYSRNWRARHPEHKRAYREANRDALRKKDAAYHATHREQAYQRKVRYYARKKGASVNDLTLAQWHEIVLAFDHCCAYCGRKMQRLTQDHVVPLSKGGPHTASNIVPACRSCNARKRDRDPLCPVQPLLLTVARKRKT